MNAIQWMVQMPDPKRFLPDRPTIPYDEVRASRARLAAVIAHVRQPTFTAQDWRIARAFTSITSAYKEINEAVKYGLVECISPPYSGGSTKKKARPAVYKAINYET